MIMLKSKSNSHKGMTIIETTIYMTVSLIIIMSTLTIMLAMVKKTHEEQASSFRYNKLYQISETINYFMRYGNARNVMANNDKLSFYNNSTSKDYVIQKNGTNLMMKIQGKPLYFFHKGYYKYEVDSFSCSKKEQYVYITIKLKTGEMIKKCIYLE